MKNIIYVSNNQVENQLGSNIIYKDGIIYLNASGMFAIDSSFTFQAIESGDVSVSICKNGKPIKSASQTLPCSGAFGSMSIPTIVQNKGECYDISVRVTGTVEMVTWSLMVVEI